MYFSETHLSFKNVFQLLLNKIFSCTVKLSNFLGLRYLSLRYDKCQKIDSLMTTLIHFYLLCSWAYRGQHWKGKHKNSLDTNADKCRVVYCSKFLEILRNNIFLVQNKKITNIIWHHPQERLLYLFSGAPCNQWEI